jgi:phosphoribosylformimino-5-aminoimidazole carboxamide ribotide isomerase
MLEIIPAIDLQSGKVVRLFEGDPDRATIYSSDPVAMARALERGGPPFLHVVDLDAATGRGSNLEAVAQVARATVIPVQVGGGVRDFRAAKTLLALSVRRVVLGTVAITDPGLVTRLLEAFGADSVTVSIDARHGRVAANGWAVTTEVGAIELAERMLETGVEHFIYTDVARDGTMRGIDLEACRPLIELLGDRVVIGGGVASDADLDALAALGARAAIVGRALYEGKVSYPRAT